MADYERRHNQNKEIEFNGIHTKNYKDEGNYAFPTKGKEGK